jgi:hypothetical protein
VRVLKDFLYWKPQPPRTVSQLIDAVANLCRLLREEVRTAMELEARGRRTSLYRFLADDWRNLLFPGASDAAFADQYAQAVTFALLLARVEGIQLQGEDLSSVAKVLRKRHLLLGRALELHQAAAWIRRQSRQLRQECADAGVPNASTWARSASSCRLADEHVRHIFADGARHALEHRRRGGPPGRRAGSGLMGHEHDHAGPASSEPSSRLGGWCDEIDSVGRSTSMRRSRGVTE